MISLDELTIVEKARGIATRMLSEKAELMPESKNIGLIYDAIKKAEKTKQSEGWKWNEVHTAKKS